MDNIGTVLTSLLTFSIGVGIGMLIHRLFFYQKKSESLLRKQIDELLINQKLYKDHVTSHFDKSASIFNELTTSYKALHEHFINSSSQLNNTFVAKATFDEISHEGGKTYKRRASETELLNDDMFTPLDYAPKISPQDKGQLSEGYGLAHEEELDIPGQSPDFSSIHDTHSEDTPHSSEKSS